MVDQAFLDALPDATICLDKDHLCLWWNAAAQELLPLQAGKAIQTMIQHQEFSKLLMQPESGVIELKSPFAKNRWLTLMLRPYTNQQKLLIVRDVTHTHLLDSIRKDFIANVSHELRTPLTVFRGYLEILQDMADIPESKLRDILAQMHGQSQRMNSIVKDLLLLSRLESVEPDTSTHVIVDVAQMIAAIGDEASELGRYKQQVITYDVDENLPIKAQPEELYSALSNIVFNAVHYTPAHGIIHIRWYQNDQALIFSVEDNGIGIAQQDIPKLTQRFYRADKARSREQDSEGTGLGLAIVKHVLLRHHGELDIQSKLGQGSCFICKFAKDRR